MRKAAKHGFGVAALFCAACAPSQAPVVSSLVPLVANPDGNYTVQTAAERLNRYSAVVAAANAGDTSVAVADAAALGLQKDDLVLIIQMQGAQIRSVDDDQFGAVQSLQGAGLYELIRVTSVDVVGSKVGLDGRCGGLRNSYNVAGKTQVVRVPQFGSLTVPTASSIVSKPWDGQTGGVVAVRASTAFLVDGALEVSGQGFRGGAAQTGVGVQPDETPDRVFFRSNVPSQGAPKGESLAGGAADYAAAGFPLGRGAPANGGGGGNGFKSGGGGGANGGAALAYDGHGVMDAGAVGKEAWDLDPAKIAAGRLTASGGGGRGGYSGGGSDQDARTTAPGDPSWLGNLRRERGGRGGRPVVQNPNQRLFLGGGGGGGDTNGKTAATGTAGGTGGGLLFLWGSRLSGSGKLLASGFPGGSTSGPSHDQGAGGGGGGGTVALFVPSVQGTLTVATEGGVGGIQGAAANAAGPGGGGGGGVLYLPAFLPISVVRSAAGGAAGQTLSASLSEFPKNGATRGNDGDEWAYSAGAVLPGCFPADLAVAVQSAQKSAVPGQDFLLTVTVENLGPELVLSAPVSGQLSQGAGSSVNWVCSATASAPGEVAECNPTSGFSTLGAAVSLSAGQKATFQISISVPSAQTGELAYQAAVAAASGTQDSDPANNTARLTVPIQPAADLQALLTVTPQPAAPGQPLTVVAGVRNMGPSDARNGTLRFAVPPGFRVLKEPFSPTLACEKDTAGGYICTAPTLGRLRTYETQLVIEPNGEPAVLQLWAAAMSEVPDDWPANNTASAAFSYDDTLRPFRVMQLAGGGSGCEAMPNQPANVNFAALCLGVIFLFSGRRNRPNR